MKIWYGYGSEHSSNLVMISRFKDAETATETSQVLEQLTELVSEEAPAGEMDIGGHTDRFSTKSRDVLSRLKIYDIGPEELEQFGYDFSAKVTAAKLILTTTRVTYRRF